MGRVRRSSISLSEYSTRTRESELEQEVKRLKQVRDGKLVTRSLSMYISYGLYYSSPIVKSLTKCKMPFTLRMF